jgi:hypothetical protein
MAYPVNIRHQTVLSRPLAAPKSNEGGAAFCFLLSQFLLFPLCHQLSPEKFPAKTAKIRRARPGSALDVGC